MTIRDITQAVVNEALARPIQILLVEDSPSDVAMTLAALRDGRIVNKVHVVGDGEDAMAFLRRTGQYSGAPRPDLVILDLNLPRKDGREVLAEVKQDDDLKVIPVVVLTTSSAEADVVKAYRLHVNAYVKKPVELDDFLKAMASIEDFRVSIGRLPVGAMVEAT